MRPPFSFPLAAAALALALAPAACRKSAGDATPVPAASASTRAAILPPFASDAGGMTGAAAALGAHVEVATHVRARSEAKAGEIVDVPARAFPSGSTPGDDGRDPTTEPAAVPASLEAFAIDALPYPNDPAQPPRTGVTRADAQRLCAERGERLCTELEWELACKGPELEAYATGDAWDAACDRDAASCASGYGVRAMGALREWTASASGAGVAAVRGAGAVEDDAGTVPTRAHRCAHRGRASEARGASDLAFRCCKGPPNTAEIAPIAKYPGFRPSNVDAPHLAKIFATIPELASLKDIRLFDPEHVQDIASKVARGVELSTAPILWSPEQGDEVLVATGRTKSMSFVVALYPLADDKYRLASYFLMLGDVSPVALAYEPTKRENLFWSTCWGCPGEQGSVRLHDDHRIVVVQH